MAEVSVNADGFTVTLLTDNTALSDSVDGSDSLVTKVVNAIGAAETTSAFGSPFCSLLPMAYIDTIGSHRLDIDSMLTGARRNGREYGKSPIRNSGPLPWRLCVVFR